MSGSVSYSVSANLNIRGNAQAAIRALANQLRALERQIKGIDTSLSGLLTHFNQLRAAAGPINSLATQMRALQNATQGVNSAGNNVARRLNAQTAAMRANTVAAQQAAHSYLALAQAQAIAAQSPRLRRQLNPPNPGGGGGAGGRDTRMSRFQRGVTDPGLGRIAGAATGAFAGFTEILRQGATEQATETLLRAQGRTPEEIARYRAAAIEMMGQIPGVSVNQGLGAIIEAQGITGNRTPADIENSLRLAPDLLRLGRLSATLQGPGTDTMEGMEPLRRFLSIGGFYSNDRQEFDPNRGQNMARLLEDALIANAGSARAQGRPGGIQPREMLNFAMQAGGSLRMMSPEMIAGPVMSMISEFGGFRSGTMQQAFFDQFVTGTMAKNKLPAFRDLDLLNEGPPAQQRRRMAEFNTRIGTLVEEGRLTPEQAEQARRIEQQPALPGQTRIFGRGLAAVRGDLFTQEFLGRRIEEAANRDPDTGRRLQDTVRRLFRGDTELGEEDRGPLLEMLRGRQTTGRYLMQQNQEREVRADTARQEAVTRLRQSGARDPTMTILNESSQSMLDAVATSFTGLLAALGNNPEVVNLLRDIINAFQDLARTARENTQPMKDFIENLRKFLRELRTLAEMIPDITRFIRQALSMLGLGGAAAGTYGGVIGGALGAISNFEDRIMRRLGQQMPGAGGMPGVAPSGGGPQVDPTALLPMPPPSGEIIEINPSGPAPGPGSSLQLQNFNPGPMGGEGGVQTAAIYLDGRQVGEGLFPILARSLNNPNQSRTTFDSRRSLGPVELAVT